MFFKLPTPFKKKTAGKLWLCGQVKGDTWEFQGVFDDEKLADKACVNENYFYCPIELNQEWPLESIVPENFRYPRFED